MTHRWLDTAGVLLLAGAALTGPAAAHEDEDRDSNRFDIRTLSNRADLISGGDALVEVRVPRHVDLDAVVISLDGRDITAAFARSAQSHALLGLVTGLADGRNRLEAGVKKGHRRTVNFERLTVTNHPIGGPVLLGSQTTPWICATPTPAIDPATGAQTNASGLSTFAV